jgi:protein phosphatase 1 regulatory subunit 11
MADHAVLGSSIGGSAPAPSAGTSQRAAPVPSATMTVTETTDTTTTNENEVLRLTLVAGPNVRWHENVQDNEGLGRKSSKRCCIFHKQRDFGESSTDSSDNENDDSGSDSGDDHEKKPKAAKRKIARPKVKGTPVPDHQRFHA